MSDEETRQKRSEKMARRDPHAKAMLDRKGPFRPRVINNKKGVYKRKDFKIDKRRLEQYEEFQ